MNQPCVTCARQPTLWANPVVFVPAALHFGEPQIVCARVHQMAVVNRQRRREYASLTDAEAAELTKINIRSIFLVFCP